MKKYVTVTLTGYEAQLLAYAAETIENDVADVFTASSEMMAYRRAVRKLDSAIREYYRITQQRTAQ